MTTQKIEPCKFIEGVCVNCNAKVRGTCEGWVEPSSEAKLLKHVFVLTAERDEMRNKYLQGVELINGFAQLTVDLTKERDALLAAGKLALYAMNNHEGNYKLNDAGCDRQNAAITSLMEAGVK